MPTLANHVRIQQGHSLCMLKEIKKKISRLEEGTNKVKAKPLKIGHVCYSVDTVRDSADLKNQRTCPDGSYGFFLTCG